jgi:hypothetical protein
MPVIAQRQNESGEGIEAIRNIDPVLQAVERVGVERFAMLRCIDPYGDTTFNRLMLPSMVKELEDLMSLGIGSGERAVAERLSWLASRCVQHGDYLKMIGD